MKKKLFLITVMVSALLCLFAISVTAASFTYEGVNYSTAQDSETGETVAKVAGNTGITTADVVIPSYVKDADGNEYKVVAFSGENFKNNTNVKSLVISSEFITEIPSWCFQNIGATTITISSPIQNFSNGCFYGLQSVTAFNIDFSHTTSICPSAFRFGTSNSIDWNDLDGNSVLNLYNVKSIGDYAFNKAHLDGEQIVWPKKLDTLSSFAFENSGYSGLVYVNATTIGDRVFNVSNDITTLIFGPDVTSISYNYSNANVGTNLQHVVFLADNVEISASGLFSEKKSNFNVYYKKLTYTFTKSEFENTTHNKFVISDVSMSYENDCVLSLTLSATSTQRVENGTLTEQETPITVTNLSLGQEYHTYASQGVNAEYCPFGSVEDFKCTKCNNLKTVASEEAEPKMGHDNTETITYKSFLENGVKSTVCKDCGHEGSTTQTASLFICLGYSAPENSAGEFAIRFTADSDAIAEYERITGKTVSYGVFAAAKSNLIDENANVTLDALSASGTVKADMAKGIQAFEIKITGFTTDSQKTAELVMGAYAIVSDGETHYMQDSKNSIKGASDSYYYTSYNMMFKATTEAN